MSEITGNTEVQMGSERSFGAVFATVFAIIALFPILGGGPVRIWALVIAAVFAIVAIVAPDVLKPLNRIWFQFGMLLGKIVSPVAMGILFFLTVTPVGLIMRAFRKDMLNQTFDPEADSYWIQIPAEQSAESSMQNQF
ncbi:MAG: SxtJ family membrane protein [Pseudomonadota bacterium]